MEERHKENKFIHEFVVTIDTTKEKRNQNKNKTNNILKTHNQKRKSNKRHK